MNCTDIDTQIDDFLHDRLDARSKSAFQRHIDACDNCRRSLDDMTALLQDLRAMPVPPPSTDFEQRVFARLRRQYPERRQGAGRFAAGFATAMAAGLALWFASSVFIPQQPNVAQPRAIAVTMNQTQTVRLMFDATSDLQRVSLSIDLPPNMQLQGYPGQQQLTWDTQLRKGPNVLALPIMAVEEGQGELVAQLSYGDTIRTFRVVLKAANDGVMQYHLEQTESA